MKDSFDWLNSLDSKKVIDFSDLDPNVVYDPDMVLSFLSNNKDVYEPLMLKMSDLGYRY